MIRTGNRACGWLLAAMMLYAVAPQAFGWGKVVWVHPTKQESEFQHDYNECQQKAAQNAANWGMKGNVFSIASDTSQCLTDMGWQKVKESDLRTQQQSPMYVIEWQTNLAAVLRTNRGESAAAVPLGASEGAVEITNKTDSSARVVWDEASYIDLGLAARVIHSGVEFSEKAKPQLPSIIAGRSRIKQVVMPAEAIAQMKGRWIRVPVFPKEQTFDQSTGRAVLPAGMTPEKLDADVSARLTGKELRILLPIEVGGVVREYTLVFTITGTKVRQTTQAGLEKEALLARTAL